MSYSNKERQKWFFYPYIDMPNANTMHVFLYYPILDKDRIYGYPDNLFH